MEPILLSSLQMPSTLWRRCTTVPASPEMLFGRFPSTARRTESSRFVPACLRTRSSLPWS